MKDDSPVGPRRWRTQRLALRQSSRELQAERSGPLRPQSSDTPIMVNTEFLPWGRLCSVPKMSEPLNPQRSEPPCRPGCASYFQLQLNAQCIAINERILVEVVGKPRLNALRAHIPVVVEDFTTHERPTRSSKYALVDIGVSQIRPIHFGAHKTSPP